MNVIDARNAHEALHKALCLITREGIRQPSRNGDVLRLDGPVVTVYRRPLERVIMWEERDANPFFHFMESLWMLGGRNDVDFVSLFSSDIARYSDDGKTFHGAYGHRWRKWFGRDQLEEIVKALRANPQCRRQVLQMWDAGEDLGRAGNDVPCNVVAHFQLNTTGELDMTVFNRSNDIIWGCYGANAVHFSILQEYVAARINRPVGVYYQVSDNWHAYLNDAFAKSTRLLSSGYYQPYDHAEFNYLPILSLGVMHDEWLSDLNMFLDVGSMAMLKTRFFRKTVIPLFIGYMEFKNGDRPAAFELAAKSVSECEAADWRFACLEWLGRRKELWLSKRGIHE